VTLETSKEAKQVALSKKEFVQTQEVAVS